MNILKRLVCGAVFLTLQACGSMATPTAPASPTPDMTGSWQGTYVLPSENPGTFTLKLTQTGLSLSGSAVISQNEFTDVPANWTGTLTTVNASTTMQFVMTYTFGDPPCLGQFKGTLDASTNAIDGAFTGENCTRAFGGTLHAERGE
jgi:hypothetical protein